MNTKQRFYEMEDYIRDVFNELYAKNSYVWHPTQLALRLWVKETFGISDIEPFAFDIHWNYQSKWNDILIKAKGSSPKLFSVHFCTKDVRMPADADHPYEWTRHYLDALEVYYEGNIVTDMTSLITYIESRIKALRASLDKKQAPFKNKLASLGITVEDYVDLANIFNRLDAKTRYALEQEAKELKAQQQTP
jgi:hypothetical protein